MSSSKKTEIHRVPRARVREIDFSSTPNIRHVPSGIPQDNPTKPSKPLSAEGKVLTEKQIRARIRRRMKRNEVASEEEMKYLYPHKPLEDWDLEELSRGRPRNRHGTFTGRKPAWVTPEMYEMAMNRYKQLVKDEMNSITTKALKYMADAITNEDVDDKGKPIVPASTKADLSKFLIEHVVGKPTQRVEQDVSIKLQSILGTVMVNPNEAKGELAPAHFPGVTMAMYGDEDIEDAEVIDG